MYVRVCACVGQTLLSYARGFPRGPKTYSSTGRGEKKPKRAQRLGGCVRGGGKRAQICSSQRVPSVPREAIHERLRGCLGRPSEGLCRQASLSRRSL